MENKFSPTFITLVCKPTEGVRRNQEPDSSHRLPSLTARERYSVPFGSSTLPVTGRNTIKKKKKG